MFTVCSLAANCYLAVRGYGCRKNVLSLIKPRLRAVQFGRDEVDDVTGH